jgi:hypothetical protein
MLKYAIFGGSFFISAYAAAADDVRPFEWETSEASLICQNSFASRDAMAALEARDARWLNETGCFFAKPGLKGDID